MTPYIYILKKSTFLQDAVLYIQLSMYIYILLNILPSSIWITVTVTATGRFLSHGWLTSKPLVWKTPLCLLGRKPPWRLASIISIISHSEIGVTAWCSPPTSYHGPHWNFTSFINSTIQSPCLLLKITMFAARYQEIMDRRIPSVAQQRLSASQACIPQ